MKFKIQIASVPHREEVVAEIWADENMLAELYRDENEKLMIEISRPNSADFWNFDYYELVDVLNAAKKRLLEE